MDGGSLTDVVTHAVLNERQIATVCREVRTALQQTHREGRALGSRPHESMTRAPSICLYVWYCGWLTGALWGLCWGRGARTHTDTVGVGTLAFEASDSSGH
jgi:hypothetical protein